MNIDQKLTAIRDLIQQDVGNRGLARDPERNLINACPDDFAKACASIADHPAPVLGAVTGFMIPTVVPPLPETDGPLGAAHLWRASEALGIKVRFFVEEFVWRSLTRSLNRIQPHRKVNAFVMIFKPHEFISSDQSEVSRDIAELSHWIAIEHAGPNHTLESLRNQPTSTDNHVAAFAASVPEHKRDRCYTMRGRDITDLMICGHFFFEDRRFFQHTVTIGIGDGGNEIGMGKIPWDTIRRNIPNGELIACRVPTDHLIVAGVSNWGAYALAAGIALLRGIELPEELFDPDTEREILEDMVYNGPLIDGVTGVRQATVDGLSWDDYIKPLVEIGKIVRS